MLWNLLCTSLLQSCTCVENSSLHHSKARSTQADKHTTSSLPILDFWWKRICPQLKKKFTSSCNCLNSVMARKEAMSGSFKIVLNLRSYCFSASLKAFEASTPSSLLSHPCKPQPDLKTGYSRCKSNSPCHKHKNFKWKMHTSQIINNSDVGGEEKRSKQLTIQFCKKQDMETHGLKLPTSMAAGLIVKSSLSFFSIWSHLKSRIELS
jgi:hypothetical protein